jgi:hypothetical protein
MCDAFLEDALHMLARSAYESYRHGCQSSVIYLARAAHTIRPVDIAKFTRRLERALNIQRRLHHAFQSALGRSSTNSMITPSGSRQ